LGRVLLASYGFSTRGFMTRESARASENVATVTRSIFCILHFEFIIQKSPHVMVDKSEVELLRQRDTKIYGSPNGPTFRFLVKRLKGEGVGKRSL
jgi:hypothetical protein